ncbi:hypothetical protein Tco_0544793 [Tanacetum coccineum]
MRPSLTCVPTRNPPAATNLCEQLAHLQKIYNGKKANSQRKIWVSLKRTGLMTRDASDATSLTHSEVDGMPACIGMVIPPSSQSMHSVNIARLKKSEKRLTKQVNMFMRFFRSDDKFYQMLTQLESQPEYGGGSGSGGVGMMSQEMTRTAARMREDEK